MLLALIKNFYLWLLNNNLLSLGIHTLSHIRYIMTSHNNEQNIDKDVERKKWNETRIVYHVLNSLEAKVVVNSIKIKKFR